MKGGHERKQGREKKFKTTRNNGRDPTICKGRSCKQKKEQRRDCTRGALQPRRGRPGGAFQNREITRGRVEDFWKEDQHALTFVRKLEGTRKQEMKNDTHPPLLCLRGRGKKQKKHPNKARVPQGIGKQGTQTCSLKES